MLKVFLPLIFSTILVGCAGIKVVNPNDKNQNDGTLALDTSGGNLKLAATYTCKLESMGTRLSAVGKTEEEARKEVIARCHDRSLISVCEPDKIKCQKN
jgi:hypothetical protein